MSTKPEWERGTVEAPVGMRIGDLVRRKDGKPLTRWWREFPDGRVSDLYLDPDDRHCAEVRLQHDSEFTMATYRSCFLVDELEVVDEQDGGAASLRYWDSFIKFLKLWSPSNAKRYEDLEVANPHPNPKLNQADDPPRVGRTG